jgi:hypothetical protein
MGEQEFGPLSPLLYAPSRIVQEFSGSVGFDEGNMIAAVKCTLIAGIGCILAAMIACRHQAVAASRPTNTRRPIEGLSMQPDQLNEAGWDKNGF